MTDIKKNNIVCTELMEKKKRITYKGKDRNNKKYQHRNICPEKIIKDMKISLKSDDKKMLSNKGRKEEWR